MRRLESLDAWRIARSVSTQSYRLTLARCFRDHLRLRDQIRGAAVSAPANIAEGYGLGTRAQFVRCLRLALAEADELLTHLALVKDLELAPVDQVERACGECNRLIEVLVGLLKALGAKTPARTS